MPQPEFVHLRVHSEYSIQDGIVRIDAAVKRAAADGMPALALTDLANTFGLVKFYQAARSAGVKAILGCDFWLANEVDRDKPHRLLLLVQNAAGYLRLCDLLSRAYRTNQHRGRAEVDKRWFSDLGTEGLLALSGAHLGNVGQALLAGNAPASEALARQWADLFPGRFYLEVQRYGAPEAEPHLRLAIRLAAKLRLPVVATHPVQFLEPDEFKAHEARVCISEGYILADQRRPKRFTPEQYFKTQAEMRKLFADLPEALANSVEIARRCNLSLVLGKSRLPEYPTPGGMSLEDYLRSQAAGGLAARLVALFPEASEREAQRLRYEERLGFELATIIQMGFAGYFLIVADFINWAKGNGVPVGPGRGSGAGSLVAYCLGITDLDPLEYGLLFERFLNPERVSMPDFDIDFCQEGRDRVIEYVRNKYGADNVSQIATFGTMAARAVVRDVGRVLDLGYNFCDQIAKLIPMQPGKQITLAMAREMEPMLREREQNEEEVHELLELGERLEGLTRNVGMHAGGVLIAPGKLTDFCPLYAAQGADSVVSQFDKDDVEAVGLVKFDFLGLTTLTILDWTEKLIREAGEPDFSLQRIPLDDRATFGLLSAGNTTAVFQLESRGMRDMIKRARPDRFEDIIALVALYRPGPMDLIPDFTDRKHGRQRVEYLDPRLQQILGPTYGIMVYQEQVMQIAQVIGGYTLGSADLLRRAMGKKKPEEMALHRDIFVSGAQRNGLSKHKASQLFDLMEKFAGYGFNKSHAAAYALLAYQTAFLKAHYPAAFASANLSAVMDDTDKVQLFHEDAVANRLAILPPDVNASDYRFRPIDAKTVRYGLGAIKGTGQSAIASIVGARTSGGSFRDLFDFCARVDKRLVNRRVIESLVRGGAFDGITDHRASLLATVGIAMETAEQAERTAHQVSLFEAADAGNEAVHKHRDVARWTDVERLQNEKAALGFYLSGHPFDSYAREVRSFVPTALGDVQPSTEPRRVAGIILGVRVQQSRRGRMGIVALDDGTGRIEITLFSELFEASRSLLKVDDLLVAEGRVVHDDFTGGFRLPADQIWDLATARDKFARCMRITCNGGSDGQRLKEVLGPYRNGKCPVSVVYINGSARCEIELGDAWRVSLKDGLIEGLGAWLKPENVQVVY
ncbi:MAG: DNA polymerase III subunit alpha [Burkholderiales bacterium]